MKKGYIIMFLSACGVVLLAVVARQQYLKHVGQVALQGANPPGFTVVFDDPTLHLTHRVYPDMLYVTFTATATPTDIVSVISAVNGSEIQSRPFYIGGTLFDSTSLIKMPSTTDTTELTHALRILPSYRGVESVSPYPNVVPFF